MKLLVMVAFSEVSFPLQFCPSIIILCPFSFSLSLSHQHTFFITCFSIYDIRTWNREERWRRWNCHQVLFWTTPFILASSFSLSLSFIPSTFLFSSFILLTSIRRKTFISHFLDIQPSLSFLIPSLYYIIYIVNHLSPSRFHVISSFSSSFRSYFIPLHVEYSCLSSLTHSCSSFSFFFHSIYKFSLWFLPL